MLGFLGVLVWKWHMFVLLSRHNYLNLLFFYKFHIMVLLLDNIVSNICRYTYICTYVGIYNFD